MKKTLYKKYFVNFLIVMLIPTIILGSVTTFFTYVIVSNNSKNMTERIFELLSKELTSRMEQIYNCRTILSSELRLESGLENPFHKYQISARLQSTKKILGFCTDIGIISAEHSKVISANGESDLKVYFDEIADFEFLLDEVDQNPLEGNLYPYDTITSTRFLYLSRFGGGEGSYLFFTFDSYQLYNGVSSFLRDMDGSLLLSSDHTPDTVFTFQSVASRQKSAALVKDFGSGTKLRQSRVMAGNYLSLRQVPQYGLNFYIVIPGSNTTNPVALVLLVSVLSLLLSVVLGVLVVSYMTKSNYRPIRQISQTLDPQDNAADELQAINHAFDQMRSDIRNLSVSLDKNRENIQKSLLVHLLYGQYQNEQEFLQKAELIPIECLYPYFSVAVISFEQRERLDLVYQYLYGLDFPELKLLLVNNQEYRQMIVLFNFRHRQLDITGLSKMVKQRVFEEFGLESAIGISGRAGTFNEIPDLFIQASDALDYCFVVGQYAISSVPEDRGEPGSGFSLSEFDIRSFENCIIEGDDITLLKMLYGKFDEIRCSNLNLNYIKMYLFDMINSIRKMIVKLNFTDMEKIDTMLIDAFLEAATLEELFNVLYSIATQLSKEINTVTPQQKLELICGYIGLHFCDIDFSVNALSDYFGISISSLSKFFKKYMKENLSDYINRLKIEKTKRLLVETDLSLETIVEQIGYSNTSSFIRKFRAAEGMTPGQFRVHHTENGR